MCIYTYTCVCVYIYIYICIYTCVYIYYTYIQDYVMAFMMGTHARLGADSPVLLLDPLVAACIAQIIIADKW
jgi:hypothetical protein